MQTETDAVLWYNVGEFGAAGYGVPNWSDDVGSLNPNIIDLVGLIGRNLFHIMHHEDVNLRTPPSINTLTRIHRLYVRCGQVLTGRAIPFNRPNLETPHSSPAGEIFRVYPVPYFKVANPYLKRWATWILMALADAMQHTENAKSVEISVSFASDVGKYLDRVYQNMAIEMFGKVVDDVIKPGFLLTDADLSTYDPSKFFTRTEMVDVVPRLDRIFTEDKIGHLSEGIPVTQLPPLAPWPENLTSYYRSVRTNQSILPDGTDSAAVAPSGGAVNNGQPVIPQIPQI